MLTGETTEDHADVHDGLDEPVPYALTDRASDLFVVDTTDVADLRRRCPELFVRRPDDAA